MNTTKADGINDVMALFKRLSIKEKITVSKAIDKEILIERAVSLDKSITSNDVSLSEIAIELKAYRSERKNNRS